MIAGRKWAKVSCEGKENKHCETDNKPGMLLERIAVNMDGEELLCKRVSLAHNGRCPEEWLWTRHLNIARAAEKEGGISRKTYCWCDLAGYGGVLEKQQRSWTDHKAERKWHQLCSSRKVRTIPAFGIQHSNRTVSFERLRLEKTRDFILCKQKTYGWADPHSSLSMSGWSPLLLIAWYIFPGSSKIWLFIN